jgi:hypothetical protein
MGEIWQCDERYAPLLRTIDVGNSLRVRSQCLFVGAGFRGRVRG